MPIQTIAIKRRAVGGPIITDEIDADVLGDFAIHPHVCAWMTDWSPDKQHTITHIPTGWACLHTRTRRAALAARRAFVGSGIDWSTSDPAAMSAEQRALGREIKREWEGK